MFDRFLETFRRIHNSCGESTEARIQCQTKKTTIRLRWIFRHARFPHMSIPTVDYAAIEKRKARMRFACDVGGHSLRDIARRAACSSEYVRRILSPDYDWPRKKLTTVERIEKALGIKSK